MVDRHYDHRSTKRVFFCFFRIEIAVEAFSLKSTPYMRHFPKHFVHSSPPPSPDPRKQAASSRYEGSERRLWRKGQATFCYWKSLAAKDRDINRSEPRGHKRAAAGQRWGRGGRTEGWEEKEVEYQRMRGKEKKRGWMTLRREHWMNKVE